MIDPRDFLAEFVEPAISLWRENQSVTHLAIHAIAQIDVLAEVVAIRLHGAPGTPLDLRTATDFRNALGGRYPVLELIRQAHKSHKHGVLQKQVAGGATQGQRPEVVLGYGFFVGVSFVGGPPTCYSKVALVLNDGQHRDIYTLTAEAMDAWATEMPRLGL